MKTIAFLFLLTCAVFGYSPEEIDSVMEDQYTYKEWTADEERMLRYLLSDLPACPTGVPISEDQIFAQNNKVLQGKMAKEIFITEEMIDPFSVEVGQRAQVMTWGLTAKDVIKVVRDNMGRVGKAVEAKGVANDQTIAYELMVMDLVARCGSPADIEILEQIGSKITHEKIQYYVSFYSDKIMQRAERGEKPQTVYERNLLEQEAEKRRGKRISIVSFSGGALIIVALYLYFKRRQRRALRHS